MSFVAKKHVRRRVVNTAMAAFLGGSGILAVAGPAGAAEPEYQCPPSGAACFYSQPGFKKDFMVIYPPDGWGSVKPPGVVGIRNRTAYKVCLRRVDVPSIWTSQAPHTEAQNIDHGWQGVNTEISFKVPSASCI